MIVETLELIKKNTGLDLKLCYYFTGLEEKNGKFYFNVLLNEKLSESKDFITLQKFSKKYKMIDISPNGVRRLAIFINNKKYNYETKKTN